MNQASNKVLALLCVILAGLIYIFYGAKLPRTGFSKHPQSTLRDVIENRLYDVRTMIKPDIEDVSNISIIGITEKSITAIEGPLAHQLTYAKLAQALKRILTAKPESVTVFLYPNIFSFDDPGISLIVSLVKENPQLYIGTMGFDTEYPSARSLPNSLAEVQEQIVGLETFRTSRQDIIRSLPYDAYRGRDLVPLFATKLSGFDYSAEKPLDRFTLNYIDPERFERFAIEDLLSAGKDTPDLGGKIVLIGPVYFKERDVILDQIFANTPWQNEWGDAAEGVPLIDIWAVGLSNLINDRVLKPAPTWITIVQTCVMAFLSAVVWNGGIGLGLVLLAGWWATFFYLHGLFFAFANLNIPLADTVLFSAFSTIAGALWQLRLITRDRIVEEAKAEAQLGVERMQSRFLDRFARELEALNDRLLAILLNWKSLKFGSDAIRDIYQKLLQSSEEFKDYLSGIKQFASMSIKGKKTVNKTIVFLRPLIDRIINQFDSTREVLRQQIDIDCPSDFKAFSDEAMLEPILFNLISNAIKYTPEGGKIIVKVVGSGNRDVRIIVTDDGPGIDPKYQKVIFEKFYRVKDDNVYRVKGNGLGLYLCNYFAGLLDAQLTVSSILGAGASFTLKL